VTEVRRIGLESLENPGNLMQSRFWGLAKKATGRTPCSFKVYRKDRQDNLLLFLQAVGVKHSFAYAPWAPSFFVEEGERGTFLEELSHALKGELPRNCICIRYDLPWSSPYSREDRLPPDHIRELRMNFGTRDRNLRKAPTDIQPVDTRIIDLTKDGDRLLAEMKPKTRYNIRLSRRRGIRVKDAPFHRLPEWYRMYLETAERNGIYRHGYGNFEGLLRTKNEYNLPNTDVHLLIAEKDGVPLAGMILAIHGDTATYLYGASGSGKRNLMPTYQLQWEAIRIARQERCKWYDLFGIPPNGDVAHPMHGLYRFKVGFGGVTFHRQGCWDYPLDAVRYHRFSGEEAAAPGYHTG